MKREKILKISSIVLSCLLLVGLIGYALLDNHYKKASGIPMTPTNFATNISGGITYLSPDGNNAVYCKTDSNGYRRVTKYDIPNSTETYMSSTSGYPLFDLVDYQWASNNYIVWFDYRNADEPKLESNTCDVFYSSLNNGSETRLSSTTIRRDALCISGLYAAFIEYGNNPGIYVANLSNQNPTPSRIFTFTGNNYTTIHLDTYNSITYLVFTDTNNNCKRYKAL